MKVSQGRTPQASSPSPSREPAKASSRETAATKSSTQRANPTAQASEARTPAAPDAHEAPHQVATVETAAAARTMAARGTTSAQLRDRVEARLDGPGSNPPAQDPAAPNRRRRSFKLEGQPPVPGEAPGLTQTTSGGQTIVSGTNADDNIQVSPRAGGGLIIQNGSDRIELTDAEARALELRAQGGNDRVFVDPSVTYDLRIIGGDGDDTITGGGGDDTIEGGAGNDTVEGAGGDDVIRGGEGNDTLSGGNGGDYINGQGGDDDIVGGNGRDVLYGLDGDDRISGSEGRDYIDGGRGNDRLHGGEGIDQVFGGRGDDDLRGGDGNDVLAGGEGTDAYNGDEGADTIFHQDGEWIAEDGDDTRTEVDMSGPEIGTSITVNGSADFQNRVESDLDALRSLPTGRAMLSDLDATGQSVEIDQTDGGNLARFSSGAYMSDNNNTPGTPSDTTVEYNPSRIDIGSDPWNERPPIVGLFHEFVHAENAGTGTMPRDSDAATGEPNLERIAMGMDIDHDGDPSTPRIQPNSNTENGFRDELNLEERRHY